jgi:general transcription factor 3C polypeptide 5 (transcription factor C subunit 1)
MKQFDISMNRGETQNVDIIPPPSFSHADIAFQYTYVKMTVAFTHVY